MTTAANWWGDAGTQPSRGGAEAKPSEPNSGTVLARTLNEFEHHHWNEVAEPFEWNVTRDDLANLIARLTAHEPQLRLAA